MPVLADIRTSLLIGFQYLPLIIISFVLFLAMGLGNIGLFMLFLGHAIIVPITAALWRAGLTDAKWIHSTGSLIPNGTSSSILPAFWPAHVSFFLGYLLLDASYIYSLKTFKDKKQWRVDARKQKALTIIITTIGLWILLNALFWKTSGMKFADLGFLPTFVVPSIFLGLGMTWYLASSQGALNIYATDIFGIVPQMIPDANKNLQPDETKPTMCVYKGEGFEDGNGNSKELTFDPVPQETH
jgi:hypothetical protein